MATERTPFVEWLDRQMLERGLRPVDIRRALGVASGAVSAWYTRGSYPNRVNALKLAEFLGVPAREVLALTGHLPPAKAEPAEPEPGIQLFDIENFPKELLPELERFAELLIADYERKHGKPKPPLVDENQGDEPEN